jgi:hypothetical protein
VLARATFGGVTVPARSVAPGDARLKVWHPIRRPTCRKFVVSATAECLQTRGTGSAEILEEEVRIRAASLRIRAREPAHLAVKNWNAFTTRSATWRSSASRIGRMGAKTRRATRWERDEHANRPFRKPVQRQPSARASRSAQKSTHAAAHRGCNTALGPGRLARYRHTQDRDQHRVPWQLSDHSQYAIRGAGPGGKRGRPERNIGRARTVPHSSVIRRTRRSSDDPFASASRRSFAP